MQQSNKNTTCTQYTTGTCQATFTFNPNQATLFDKDPVPISGPWGVDGTCPAGQTMFMARQPVSQPNQTRPYFYTCAANLDEAKNTFATQQPNQTWELSQSRSICNTNGNTYTTCVYSPPSGGQTKFSEAKQNWQTPVLFAQII